MSTKQEKKKEFHSGEKLKLAISLKGYSIQEVADKLGVTYGTVQQRQQRGFGKKISSSVSTLFQVEDWVFGDYYPDRETFKKIILDPSLQDQYRPERGVTPLKPVIKEDGLSSAVNEDDLEEAISGYRRDIQNTKSFRFLEQYFFTLEMKENTEPRESAISANFDSNEDWADYEHPLQSSNNEIRNYRQGRHGDVLELLGQISQLFLLGESGSGKSSCLKWYCFESIKKYKPGEKVVIYIDTGLVRYRTAQDIKNIVHQVTGFSQNIVNSLFETERLVLLFDALNECDTQAQDKYVQQIKSLLTDWPAMGIVLSSRSQSRRHNFDFPVFTIQPLKDKEKQINFLESFMKNEGEAATIINKLHEQPGGETTANNPWMLFMLYKFIHKEADLPARRALMFRFHANEWYKQETKKVRIRNSTAILNKEMILNKLAHAAVHMRLHGHFKEAPLSWIIETLGEEWLFDENVIELFRQSLICTLNADEDTFSFNHETWQEYFAAEYALDRTELFEKISQDKKYEWGTVLIFAFSLGKKPSQNFIKEAWRINPLIVALMVRDIESIQGLPFADEKNDFLEWNLRILLQKDGSNLSDKFQIGLKIENDSFHEVLFIIESCFEFSLGISSTVSKRVQYITSKWIPLVSPFQANKLVEKGIAKTDDFSNRMPKWINEVTSPTDAKYLLDYGFAKKGNFSKQISDWIKNASMTDAITLADCGFAERDDFSKWIPKWVSNVSFYWIRVLAKCGIISWEDFSKRLSSFIEEATVTEANFLVNEGILSLEDFSKQIPRWIRSAQIDEAAFLVNKGFVSWDDLTERLPLWIKNAEFYEAEILVNNGLAEWKDFTERYSYWGFDTEDWGLDTT